MGPRLGRVEYLTRPRRFWRPRLGFNGATLRTRGIPHTLSQKKERDMASMGPRLGRVEYNQSTPEHYPSKDDLLQWGHA